eukprot:10861971-Ditylum_brightwellii.AAC.1
MSTLINHNKLHLYQAYVTPFTKNDIQEYIGKYGTGEGAKEILAGNFDPNNFNNLPAMNYWIKNNLKQLAAANS